MLESLKDYLEKYEKVPDHKAPSHWKADIVNQIIDLVGRNPKYDNLDPIQRHKKSYVYWLVLIKRSKKGWGEMMYILKQAGQLDDKYSKGGFITNKLKINNGKT